MKNNLDPIHGIEHVDSIETLYKEFKKTSKMKVDDNVMKLSATWHDTWKAKHPPYKQIITMLRDEFYEGLGSMFIFRQQAQKIGLNKGLTDNVSYVIRKHSLFNLLPRMTTESKLLTDFDNLEMWNPKRFVVAFLSHKGFGINDFGVNLKAMEIYGKMRLYYDWSNDKLKEVKTDFFDKAHEIYKKTLKNKKPAKTKK